MSRPAEEMELSQGSGLLRLNILQVEAPHQEVIAPDVLRHQVHLQIAVVSTNKQVQISNYCTYVHRFLLYLFIIFEHKYLHFYIWQMETVIEQLHHIADVSAEHTS